MVKIPGFGWGFFLQPRRNRIRSLPVIDPVQQVDVLVPTDPGQRHDIDLLGQVGEGGGAAVVERQVLDHDLAAQLREEHAALIRIHGELLAGQQLGGDLHTDTAPAIRR